MVVPAPRAILLSPDCAETECTGKLNRKTHAPIKSSAPALPHTPYLDSFDMLAPFCLLMFTLLVYIPERAPAAFLASRLPVRHPGSGSPHHEDQPRVIIRLHPDSSYFTAVFSELY